VIGEKLRVLEVGQSLPLVRPNFGASESTAR
jgi:hypothetical protein